MLMSLRAFLTRNFRQPLKKTSGEVVNKKTQLGLNNLATHF